WITTVYEGGAGCDRLIWRRRDGTYERVGDSRLVSRDQEDRMAAFVRELQGCGVRYLEEIREKLSRHSAVGK
ncbi:MAG: hypothetical protein N2595_03710, partial [bacterium]|nr:hypothetical protein [bacterium]